MSLQRIAAELGVTKAAIYQQFHSKDDTVIAVSNPSPRRSVRSPSRGSRLEFSSLISILDTIVVGEQSYMASRETASRLTAGQRLADVPGAPALLRRPTSSGGPAPGYQPD